MTATMRTLLTTIAIAMTVPAYAEQAPAATAHETHEMKVVTYITPDQATFNQVPGAPACFALAGLRGDPSKEASTFMSRMSPGCVAPRHWHKATEESVVLQGNPIAHMDGAAPIQLKPGSYSQFPGRHVHRFKCAGPETCYVMTVADAAFDIHWVDRAGKEIGLDQAIADDAKDTTPWK